MDSLVSLSVFAHLHFDQLLAQGLAINGSLIITSGMAEPSHPKEEDLASKARDCASHLPLLPFATISHPPAQACKLRSIKSPQRRSSWT